MIASEPSGCTACEKPFTGLYIVWHLPSLSLRLHADCARSLASRIKRNAAWLSQREQSGEFDPFTYA